MLPECISTPAKSQADPLETDFDLLSRPTKARLWGEEITRSLTAWGADLFPDGWDFGTERITRSEFCKMVANTAACATALELRAPVDKSTGEVGKYRIHCGNYCHSIATCPQCAARAQDVRMGRFSDPIKALAATHEYAYLLTFTLPPAPSWAEGLAQIREAMQAFRKMGQKRKNRRGGYSLGEWHKVKGAIAKVELKRGMDSGMPHVHIHALAFCKESLDYRVYKERIGSDKKKWTLLHPFEKWNEAENKFETVGMSKLSLEWNAASAGKGFSVDCKRLKLRDKDKAKGLDYIESVASQAVEVLKYATKFSKDEIKDQNNLFVLDFAHIKSATYGRRLFATYGLLRGFGNNDFELDEEEGDQVYAGAFWTKEEKRYTQRIFDGPIFKRETSIERLKVLNSYLGRSRRRRSAIMRARLGALEGLPPKVICEELDAEKRVVFTEIEPPQYVMESPRNPEVWEKWVDDLGRAMRAGYVALRDSLRLEAEDPRAWELFLNKVNYQAETKKPLHERGAAYWDRVVESFLEVINSPARYIPLGYAYSS